jgi:hypothetical protein
VELPAILGRRGCSRIKESRCNEKQETDDLQSKLAELQHNDGAKEELKEF